MLVRPLPLLMNPYVLALLLFTLGLGTTITFSSSHWMLAWIGLEINTLAIIPLIIHHHHPRAAEATTKYFLTQATAAATLLFASLTNAWLTGQWDIQLMSHPLPTTIAVLALAIKMGIAPLHTWLPEVLQGLDLITGLLLSTWQKLAPFALLVQLQLQDYTILTIIGLVSILVGGWGGLNQTQLRKILAYSSIAHLGWIVLIVQFMPSLTLLALTVYIIMTTSAFLVFDIARATSINALGAAWTKAPVVTTAIPFVLLSLGGLPPLTGFIPKWIILQELTKQGLPAVATLSAIAALLSLYFYLRLSYAATLTMAPNNLMSTTPWRFQRAKMAIPLSIALVIATLLLPITPGFMAILSY